MTAGTTKKGLFMDADLAAHIKRFFRYEQGKIIRTDRRNSNGSYDKDGYLIYKIKGKQIKAHRLAWFLCNGYMPKGELDHINRNRTDNRIENLREADRKIQAHNTTRKINKDTGEIGIYLDKTTKGLLAKYTFKFGGKTYRCRTLQEAKQKKDELWNKKSN